MLKCVVMNPKYTPTKKHPKKDAGWDVYAKIDQEFIENNPQFFQPLRYDENGDLKNPHEFTLLPMERAIIPTGVRVQCPHDTYFRVADRSGNASKLGLHVMAGVVDSIYTGEVKVVVINLGDTGVTIKDGMKIAQLIPTKIDQSELLFVDSLDETERGEIGGVNEV